jgi:hypothetical protein
MTDKPALRMDRLPCCGRRPQPPDEGWWVVGERFVTRKCCPLRDDAGRVIRRRQFQAVLEPAQAALSAAVGRPVVFLRWKEVV